MPADVRYLYPVILRDYQARDVAAIHDAFESGARSVLHVLPTGGGKTVEFAEIARLCHQFGTQVGILVHRDTLLGQAKEKLDIAGVSYSVVAPGRTDFGDLIRVCSVQTLARRLDKVRPFDLLIVDEGHHAIAPTYRKITGQWPECRVLGVTATPLLASGRGLAEVYDRMTLGPSVRQLMDDGYLCEATTFGARRVVDLSRVRTMAGDYNSKDLAEAMDRSVVTGDAVEHYARLCPGRPAVAFCVSVKHAEDVASAFREAGYSAESIDGTMPTDCIRATLARLAAGTLQIVSSCDLISEGFDAPAVTAGILLRPTKSLALYMQQVGRVLRPVYPPGADQTTAESRKAAMAASVKPNALILDHAGNAFRHGLVDDARQWALEGSKRKSDNAMAVKTCPQCYGYSRPWEKSCAKCGHVFIIGAGGGRPQDVDQEDGELVVLDAETMSRMRRMKLSQCRTYKDLVEYARLSGYHPSWAYKKWISRGGHPAEAVVS